MRWVVVVSVLAAVSVADAFEFDGWAQGMSLDAVLRLAGARNLPVGPGDGALGLSGFDAGVAVQGYGSVREYRYPARMVNYPCTVTLAFNDELRLAGVHVRWVPGGPEAIDALMEAVGRWLEPGHGKRLPCPRVTRAGTVEQWCWGDDTARSPRMFRTSRDLFLRFGGT